MSILSFLISIFITLNPSPYFNCDGDILTAKIRNNLNGDFALTEDLASIDKGAFVVINWRELKLMLPVSFKVGDIAFTDKKWLWSYQDNENGLRINNPRLAKVTPSGKIIEYSCKAIFGKDQENLN